MMSQQITGHQYEHIVAEYLRTQGYTNVKVTKASGDYGVDVIATKGKDKYAVQCKYYSVAVNQDAVREVFAGKAYYGCNKAMVVTNNTYTKSAIELAKKNEVVLLSNVSSSAVVAKHTLLKVVGFLALWSCAYCVLIEALGWPADSTGSNTLLIVFGLVSLLVFSKGARHLLGKCFSAIWSLFSKLCPRKANAATTDWIDDVEAYDAFTDDKGE